MTVVPAIGAREPRPVAAIQPAREARLPVAKRDALTASGPVPALIAEPGPVAIETELGGTFYLLNLALFLGLYGDFTTPLRPGIALDPWDYLALLGPSARRAPVRGDPLWPMLARLAEREATRRAPGRGFRPPPVWRTPRAWLVPFDHGGRWRWSAAGGTLRIIHPAGFAVVAVPRSDELGRRATRPASSSAFARVAPPSLHRSALR